MPAYQDIFEDPATSIIDGATHYSPTIEIKVYQLVGYYVSADSIPAGTTIAFQLSGKKEKPTLDSEFVTVDTSDFTATTEPSMVEKRTSYRWFRYKIINGGGADITGFSGSISCKGA